MKIIYFLMLLAIVVPCQAQRYHDAHILGVKDNVKSIIYGGWKYEFGRDGAIKKITVVKINEEIYPEIVRDSSQYVSTLTVYTDEECTNAMSKTYYVYENGLVSTDTYVSFGWIFGDDTLVTKYYYNDNGLCIGSEVNGEDVNSKYAYDNIKLDNNGNWISRDVYKVFSSGNKIYDDTETREIVYWDTDSRSDVVEKAVARTAAGTGWQSLVGKKLSLTTYGISQNGQEVNRFNCSTGEHIILYSNGVLYWNNRHDGNTSYEYRIDGNMLYITQTSGKVTQDRWFELVGVDGNEIKTESNVGTYRYFKIED